MELYPALFSIKQLKSYDGEAYPLAIAANKKLIDTEDAYLISNGTKIFLFIGDFTEQSIVSDILGVNNFKELESRT